MHATHLLWQAAGRPRPTSADGEPVAEQRTGDRCAVCGEAARHLLSDGVSDNFSPVVNPSRLWPFGGDRLCAPCLWAYKAMPFRCAGFFARPTGVWFFGIRPLPGMPSTRPRILPLLTNPPEPPFVAGLPLFGVDSGGEANLERTRLSWDNVPLDVARRLREVVEPAIDRLIADAPPDVKPERRKRAAAMGIVGLAPPWPSSVDWTALRSALGPYADEPWFRSAVWPLVKLQSKPIVPYCRVATSSARYWFQVDDAAGFELDVATWREARSHAEPLFAALRASEIHAEPARAALRTLAPPDRTPLSVLATWAARTRPLRRFSSAPWWPLFADLLA